MGQTVLRWIVRLSMRAFARPILSAGTPLGFGRRALELLALGAGIPPKGTTVGQLSAGGVPVSLVRVEPSTPQAPNERHAILYCHGGGFILGSPRTFQNIAAHLAARAGADVHLVDYRLAPEHPYPAPVDDVFAAYKTMIERGHDPRRIAIAGDSAGGALAVSATLVIAEMDLPKPAALVLISPFLDLGLSGASHAGKARTDPVLKRDFLLRGARDHAGGLSLTDPRVSPIYAALAGLPPTLIQVGEDEILLDDAVRFADRAWAAGVEVELQRFPRLWHEFQVHAGILEESTNAIGDIAAFLARNWE